MARAQFTDALLLRSLDYAEADRILTFLTSDYGKVGVIARGARKSTRRFAGALEPYCVVRAEVSIGRGELGTLRQAAVAHAFPRILADLPRIAVAGAGLELVREMIPAAQPDARVFQAATAFLELLNEEVEPVGVLLAFEARLLALSGFSPGLTACGRCGVKPASGQAARFDADVGAIVCRACGGGSLHLSGNTRELLARALGAHWHAVAKGPWRDTGLAEARRALSRFIERHLSLRLPANEALFL